MAQKQTRKPHMVMMVNSRSDYSIQDNAGTKYTPEEAKAIWEAGYVIDCNMAFQRLASLGFDIEALKQHYASGKR